MARSLDRHLPFRRSNALESWSVGRARRAVEALKDLSPATVRLVTADGEKVVLAETVQVNTKMLGQSYGGHCMLLRCSRPPGQAHEDISEGPHS